jgi:hypothetical protein
MGHAHVACLAQMLTDSDTAYALAWVRAAEAHRPATVSTLSGMAQRSEES